MNLHRSIAAALLAILLPADSIWAATTPATVVEAVFDSAATVPVTATEYFAAGYTVNLALNFAPTTGVRLTVVNTTGASPITGRFANLAQGQTVALPFGNANYRFAANYFGSIGSNPPALTVQPDGGVGISFHGIPGRRYIVQRSIGGLDDWETLATLTADEAGRVSFTDENPPPGRAFYRLGLP